MRSWFQEERREEAQHGRDSAGGEPSGEKIDMVAEQNDRQFCP